MEIQLKLGIREIKQAIAEYLNSRAVDIDTVGKDDVTFCYRQIEGLEGRKRDTLSNVTVSVKPKTASLLIREDSEDSEDSNED